MSKQIVAEHVEEWSSAFSAEIDSLRTQVRTQLSTLQLATARCELLKQTMESQNRRLVALEEQRAMLSPSPSSSPPAAGSAVVAADNETSSMVAIMPQIQQLLKMHTEAIGHTWQWTSSLLLALMQQRSTNLQVHQMLLHHDEQFALVGTALQGPEVSSPSTRPQAHRDPAPVSSQREEHLVDVVTVATPASEVLEQLPQRARVTDEASVILGDATSGATRVHCDVPGRDQAVASQAPAAGTSGANSPHPSNLSDEDRLLTEIGLLPAEHAADSVHAVPAADETVLPRIGSPLVVNSDSE
eukprot:6078223-Amphidinium_carterae.1